MVNKPLIRPYYWGGSLGGVGWLAIRIRFLVSLLDPLERGNEDRVAGPYFCRLTYINSWRILGGVMGADNQIPLWVLHMSCHTKFQSELQKSCPFHGSPLPDEFYWKSRALNKIHQVWDSYALFWSKPPSNIAAQVSKKSECKSRPAKQATHQQKDKQFI